MRIFSANYYFRFRNRKINQNSSGRTSFICYVNLLTLVNARLLTDYGIGLHNLTLMRTPRHVSGSALDYRTDTLRIMKCTTGLLLLLLLITGCSSTEDAAPQRNAGISTPFMNYEMRDDWIIEYYQFHNVSFRNPNAPFGYALYIFPDNLYYVAILRNSQDFQSRPYDKRLLTRSYITPIEMRRTEIHFERAEFKDLPAVLPIKENDQQQCRQDGPTVRIGYKDNDRSYLSRTTSYTGCDPDTLPEEFHRLQGYMSDLFAQLRVRQNVAPDANIENAIAEIEAAIDTTFMRHGTTFPVNGEAEFPDLPEDFEDLEESDPDMLPDPEEDEGETPEETEEEESESESESDSEEEEEESSNEEKEEESGDSLRGIIWPEVN